MSAPAPSAGGVESSRSTRGDRPAPTLVLKFGSSVLRDEADLVVAVHEIYRWWRLGYRVVAVVSAFAGVTDDLLAATGAAPERPAGRELARGLGSDAPRSGTPAASGATDADTRVVIPAASSAKEFATVERKRPTDHAAHAARCPSAVAARAADDAASPAPATADASAFAILLATGERQVAALLVLELERAGVPARVLDPAGIGLTTRGAGLDADPARVDRRRIERALAACPVAVLPGFQAVDGRGVATLLGRGGSDMTAVFVAHRLGARCRLLKDVPGVFESRPAAATDSHVDVAAPVDRRPAGTTRREPPGRPAGTTRREPPGRPAASRDVDPAPTGLKRPTSVSAGVGARQQPRIGGSSAAEEVSGSRPRLFSSMTWKEAAVVGNGVVQARALAFAERERFPLEVAAPAQGFATCIGDRLASLVTPRDTVPLTVAMLGLGTVGGAVYRRLAALPRRFRVVGVAVRDRGRHLDGEVPEELLSDDPWAVLERPADVVVEALPGAEPARALIERALATGRAVVTANKAALAAAPHLLETEAALAGPLYASASVGGAVPVLETASRLRATGGLEAVHGVLNGTSNYVLERLEAGATLAEALAEARHRGLAEADPTADLDGSDVARKLILLARAAFGVSLAIEAIPRHRAEELDAAVVRAVARTGRRLRVVGSLVLRDGRVHAAVRLRGLPPGEFLAGARGEENRVVFERRDARPLRLAGKGAGGRPTAEAVLADLFDHWRLRRARAGEGSRVDLPSGFHVERETAGRDAGRFRRNGGAADGSEAADLRVGRGGDERTPQILGDGRDDESSGGRFAEEAGS